MDTQIAELIKAFDVFDGLYKRDELNRAIALKAEITPHLIRILEDLGSDPAGYVAEDHYANVYAAILLAHFQEPAAHLPIIRAFCIAEQQRENLWGDMVTATLPALLYQTCNGSFESIKELAGNRQVYEYVRGSALEALSYGLALGTLGREEVVDFYQNLFTGQEADPDSDFWGNIVSLFCDIHPRGAMETIRRAYDEGLVNPGYVGLEEVEAELARDEQMVLAELRVHAKRSVPEDIHDYCAWFSCFRESGDEPQSLPAQQVCALDTADSIEHPFEFTESRGKKLGRKKPNRNKNKMARKSRKKNTR